MTRVYTGERTFLSFAAAPVERLLYRLAGTDDTEEQHWTTYVGSMLAFNLLGFVALYPPATVPGVAAAESRPAWRAVAPELSFNTAVSFVTNTNWQNYGGERRCPIWCRWPGSPFRTSFRRPRAWRSPSR